MNTRGIIAIMSALVVGIAFITTKSCRKTITVSHGTGYQTIEERWYKNKIVELLYYHVLPINTCYCCDDTGRRIWYSKRLVYYTKGVDWEWGTFDQSRVRAIDFCKRTNNELIEISQIIRIGDLRNLDDDDELRSASIDAGYDIMVIVKYFKAVVNSSIPEITYGRILLGESESLKDMK